MAGYALPHNMQHKAASTATTLRLLKRLASNRVLEGRLKISSKQKPLLTRYNDGDIIHVEDGGQPGAGIKGPYSILAFWNSTTATMDENEIGRAHVCTPVTNAHIVFRLLLEKKKKNTKRY